MLVASSKLSEGLKFQDDETPAPQTNKKKKKFLLDSSLCNIENASLLFKTDVPNWSPCNITGEPTH